MVEPTSTDPSDRFVPLPVRLRATYGQVPWPGPDSIEIEIESDDSVIPIAAVHEVVDALARAHLHSRPSGWVNAT